MPLKLSEKDAEKLLKNLNKENKSDLTNPKNNYNSSFYKKRKGYNKYKNKKIKVNGISFDSTAEYRRYCYLQLLEKGNIIHDLRYHNKKDKIIINDNPRVYYEPDFCYYDENNEFIIEDLKGYQTKEFILKKKIIISKLINHEIIGKFILVKEKSPNNFIKIEEYTNKKDENLK